MNTQEINVTFKAVENEYARETLFVTLKNRTTRTVHVTHLMDQIDDPNVVEILSAETGEVIWYRETKELRMAELRLTLSAIADGQHRYSPEVCTYIIKAIMEYADVVENFYEDDAIKSLTEFLCHGVLKLQRND